MTLHRKLALITGAGPGLGKACAGEGTPAL